MSKGIWLSLVVSTVGRTVELQKFLESLLSITSKDFEVVIVDQNTDDRLGSIIDGFSNRIPLKYLKMDEMNASKGRNLGLSHAEGLWVGFPDDDCCYAPDTIENLKVNIMSSNATVILGAVVDFENRPLGKFFRRKSKVSLFNLSGKVNEPGMFFNRTRLQDFIGFNENYGPGSSYYAAEGVELLVRILKESDRVIFNSDIRVYHPNKFTKFDDQVMNTGFIYSYGFGCLIAEHFGLWALCYIIIYLIKFFIKLILQDFKKKKFAVVSLNGLFQGMNKPLRSA